MGFLVFTCVGLAAGVLHVVLGRGRHMIVSALAVGVMGAWMGALLAGTLVQGGWASFGALQFAGAIVGAIGSVEVLEQIVDAYLRRNPEEAS